MAGRPLKFTSVSDLQLRIDWYFDNTPKEEITITGLALALDCSRDTLCEYDKKDEFSDTIKKAKDRVENAYEMRGLKVGNAFDIFRLKNMGWRDSHELTGANGKDLIPGTKEREESNKAIDQFLGNKKDDGTGNTSQQQPETNQSAV